MVAEHLIAKKKFSGKNKHKSDNANMSNYKFCKSEPPKSQGFQHTDKHCWVRQSLKCRLMPKLMGFLY